MVEVLRRHVSDESPTVRCLCLRGLVKILESSPDDAVEPILLNLSVRLHNLQCFEERSCNPMENFQDALKQALVQKKEHIKSCRQLPGSPVFSTHSDQQVQKSGVMSFILKAAILRL
ncbi:hypothetical protein CRYUN_Cryun05aG0220700 [Craigia yunnanensis]